MGSSSSPKLRQLGRFKSTFLYLLFLCVISLLWINITSWFDHDQNVQLTSPRFAKKLPSNFDKPSQILKSDNCGSDEQTAFDNIRHLDPLDPDVLHYIQCFRLHPPSSEPYNLKNPFVNNAHYKQVLTQLFHSKPQGFFIECGANDGEFLSQTLNLEKRHGWTGLLIEAHPKYASEIRNKHRKAWYSDVCLSPNRTIQEMELLEPSHFKDPWMPGISKLDLPELRRGHDKLHFKSYGMVRCFPLVSVMAALGVSHVDFFSLDVQGVEYKILKTLPFDETLEIDVFQLEHNIAVEGTEAIRNLMIQNGYRVLVETSEDFVFKLTM